MNTRAPKLYASLLGFFGTLVGCLALSASVQAGAGEGRHGFTGLSHAAATTTSGSDDSAACIVFRDGFDLTQSPVPAPGVPVRFVTSGGYTITVNLDNVTIGDAAGGNKIVHSGNLHEYLNGKLIKDWGGEPQWDDTRRSLILGDSTKVTLVSSGQSGVILHTSIYDGVYNLQIDNCSNTITHQSADPGDTWQRDAAQYDGEVATFSTDTTTGAATYANYYNEDRNSHVIGIYFILGTTGGTANPNQVRDFYDDPRRFDT